jgi:hypothetical protein
MGCCTLLLYAEMTAGKHTIKVVLTSPGFNHVPQVSMAVRSRMLRMAKVKHGAPRIGPDWAEPCFLFADYIFEVDDLVTLTKRAVNIVAGIPQALGIPMTDESDAGKEVKKKNIVSLKNSAQIAEAEIERGFPLLHSHSVMGMWGALEAMIDDLAASWMGHNPSVLSEPSIAKIRIPFAEFQSMEQSDRLRFLVTELKRDLRSDLKSGATKFESLLKVLGLGGPVDKRIRDVLFETQQLRNVIAHRGGIADRKLIASCPQFNYSIGDRVEIDSALFVRIENGFLMYSVVIVNRCRAIHGLNPMMYNSPSFEGALSDPDE